MAGMLQQGARFPQLSLKTVDGSVLDLPSGVDARYAAVLFYRGHW